MAGIQSHMPLLEMREEQIGKEADDSTECYFLTDDGRAELKKLDKKYETQYPHGMGTVGTTALV